ncbi:MAG: hypothetical protein ABFD79_06275 [Phycisphaerales bacterium]
MKIKVIKGKLKGIRGRVVGVYMDGRYDINVTNRKANEPKYRVIKISDCQEIA